MGTSETVQPPQPAPVSLEPTAPDFLKGKEETEKAIGTGSCQVCSHRTMPAS